MVLDKLGLFLCLPARRVNGHTDIKQIYPPSRSPARIHFLANLFFDLLRLSIVLIRCLDLGIGPGPPRVLHPSALELLCK